MRSLTVSKGSVVRVVALIGLVGASVPAMAEEPEPQTYVDVMVPSLDGWADLNTLTVDADSPEGRTFIYPDEQTKLADLNGALDGTARPARDHRHLHGRGRRSGDRG